MFLVTIGPFYIKNTLLLLIIILLNIFIVTGWYIYGYCFCNDIENHLTKNKTTETAEKENTKKSFVTILFEKIFPFIDENYIHNLLSVIPFFSTIICCFTLYNNFYKCRIRKLK
jgi:hypothetical protein